MVEDRILVWRFNRGSKDALQRIYEKYKSDLLGLAVSLLRDRSAAEDVVQDAFVSFAKSCGTFRLNGTLKGYLSTCIANGARDRNRLKSGKNAGLDVAAGVGVNAGSPMEYAMDREESGKVQDLLGRLPYEQREIIVLHLHQGMRFWEIARSLNVSINTVQSRYRYGLEKLRSLTNGEVTK